MRSDGSGDEASDAARARFHPAYESLDAGEVEGARAHAQHLLADAEDRGDRYLEAEALLCLDLCDRLASRFRRSHDAAQRAAHLFQATGNAAGEATALTVQSYAAASLGRNEEAVESALLAVRLNDDSTPSPQQTLALNYLGIAHYWSRDYDSADAALESAVRLAEACQPPITFQPMANLVLSQLLRAVTHREHTGSLPPLDVLTLTMESCAIVAAAPQHVAIMRGIYISGRATWPAVQSICHSWRGEFLAAGRELAEARNWIEANRSGTWLSAFAQWAQVELLWAQGNATAAQEGITQMLALARQFEHEQLGFIAYGLASHIYESQGQFDRAVGERRKLQRREHRVRMEGLGSRARVVDWQLAVRSSERDIQSLKAMSRQLERASLEDPLTGIANRRRIEQELARLIDGIAETEEQPPCVALIDVDRFKQVNDGYSHQVGDQVLVAVAALLVGQVREGDVVGRLAGDEFVILFPRCDTGRASEVCHRLEQAVAMRDWSDIASGLSLSISVGVSQARADDSVASALNRSDLAMYEAKRAETTEHIAKRT